MMLCHATSPRTERGPVFHVPDADRRVRKPYNAGGKMTDVCPKCSSTKLEAGMLMGAAIQLERATTMAKVFAGAEVKARV